MKLRSWGAPLAPAIILVFLLPESVLAYFGPGTGLSAFGVFLAVVAGIMVALFGFVWYPIKRLLRKKKQRDGGQGRAGE